MSQTIDSKVVEMRFDNNQFESNVNSTIKSIDKLEKSLDLSGAAKGIENVSSKFKGIDFSPIANGVEGIKNKFSVLETIAVGALLNIGSQVEQMAVSLVKSMSAVDGITSGWAKYNEKTASVQTIMAATGKSIDEVDKQLSKLMWYTDETSYDFVDMTNNIGKFTSAGVSLEDATSAMMGISNWAALSGANIQQASHAMYNLSQALGTGSVKLIDWKSIENANMATVEFKQQVIDTAKAMGTLDSSVDITATNFNQFLNQKDYGVWFTSDVLIEVLKKYGKYAEAVYDVSDAYDTCSEAMEHVSDKGMELSSKAFRVAQEAKTFEEAITSVKDAVSSKWMQTFELMFGNYQEAKKLWTDLANSLYDLFALGGDSRNEMLQIWKDKGGQKAFIKSIWNIYDAIIMVKDTIAGAFRDIFPPMTGEKLAKLTKQFRDFTAKFKMSDETADKLRRTFKGLFALLDIGKQAISAIISGIKLLIPNGSSLNFSILDITATIGDWIVKLDSFLKKNDSFRKGIKTVIDVLKMVPNVINDIIKKITGKDISELFDMTKNGAANAIKKLNEVTGGLDGIAEKISKIPDLFKSAVEKVKNIPSIISNGFESLTNISTNEVFSSIKSKAESALDSVRKTFAGFKKTDTSGIDSLTKSVNKKVSPLEKAMGKLKSIFEPIANFFKKVAAVFKKVFGYLKKVFEPIISYFAKIGGMLAKAFQSLGKSLMDAFEGGIGFDEVLDVFNGGVLAIIIMTVKNFISRMSKMSKDLSGVTGGFKGLIENSNKILVGVTDVLDGVKGSLEAWQQNLKAKTLMTLAGAIAVITAAIVVLSTIDSEKLDNALTVITAEFVELMASFSMLTKSTDGKSVKNMQAATKNLLIMSVAVLMLSMAMKSLSKLDPTALVRSTTTVVTLIMALATAAKIMSSSDGTSMIKGASGLMSIAVAIRLLIKPITELGKLPLGNLIEGLAGVTELIATLSVSAILLSKNSKGLAEAGVGLIAVATAVRILTSSVANLGKMNGADLVSGLLAVTELIAAMTAMTVVMSKNTDGMVKGGVGLIAIATALRVLVNSVKLLGNMDAIDLISGLYAVTELLAAMTVMSVVMSKNTDGLVKGGVGLIAIATALRILVNSVMILGSMDVKSLIGGLAAVTALLAELTAVTIILSGNTSGLMAAGAALIAISAGMLIVSKAISSLAEQNLKGLLQAVATLGITLAMLAVALKVMKNETKGAAALLAVSVALMAIVPPIIALSKMKWKELKTGLLGLAITLGIFIAAGLFAGAVAPGLLALSAALLALGLAVAAIGAGVLMAAKGITMLAEISDSGAETIKKLLGEVIASIPAFIKAVGQAFVGIAKEILTSAPGIIKEAKGVFITLLEVVSEVAPKIIDVVIDIIDKLLKKLADKSPSLVNSGFKILKAILTGIKDNIGGITETVADIITRFLDALSKKLPEIVDSGFKLIISFINSLSDAIKENAEDLRKAAIKLIDSILTAIFTFLGINNEKDSKDPQSFLDIGKKLVMGIINGIGSLFSKLWDIGKKIINKILGGIKSIATKIGDTVVGTVKQIPKTLSDYWDTLKSVGKKIIIAIKNGIIAVKDKILDIGGSIYDWVKEGLEDFWDSLVDIGKWIIEGLVNGIKAGKSFMEEAIDDVKTDVVKWFMEKFAMGSPSKLTRQYGLWIDEGFAIGISDGTKSIEKSTDDVYSTVDKKFESINDRIANIIDSDIDMNPVIKPVLDLSEVANGAGQIDSMMNPYTSISLASSAASSQNSRLSNQNANNNTINVNNRDVVEEIRNLRSDMDTMTKSMHRMQIVMDTGALVGQITGPIDAALGRRAIIKGRGI